MSWSVIPSGREAVVSGVWASVVPSSELFHFSFLALPVIPTIVDLGDQCDVFSHSVGSFASCDFVLDSRLESVMEVRDECVVFPA